MKVRKAYKGRKLGQFLQADLKRLYIKKKLRSVLQNEGKWWTEFYRYVKRREGSRENIPAIKDCSDCNDSIEKAKSLNSFYVSVASRERNVPQILSPHSSELFNSWHESY